MQLKNISEKNFYDLKVAIIELSKRVGVLLIGNVHLSLYKIVLSYISNSMLEDEMVDYDTVDEFLCNLIGENSRCLVCYSHLILFSSTSKNSILCFTNAFLL